MVLGLVVCHLAGHGEMWNREMWLIQKWNKTPLMWALPESQKSLHIRIAIKNNEELA